MAQEWKARVIRPVGHPDKWMAITPDGGMLPGSIGRSKARAQEKADEWNANAWDYETG